MSNARVWLFRFLLLAAGAFFVWTWFQPWWESVIREAPFWIQIRPWGLEHNLGPYVVYIPELKQPMPAFFAPAMWVYLGLSIAAILFSLFAKNKQFNIWKLRFNLPSFLIGVIGLSYIVIAAAAYVLGSIRTAAMGVFFRGTTYVEIDLFPVGANADSDLTLGFWLACAVGPLLVILALLRNKIIGTSKIES
ncbi:hypothetical protein ACFLY3_03105 [Chloroflexota bacterium]